MQLQRDILRVKEITGKSLERYDAIGNLIEDKGEGVQIEWTVYGKIRRVTSRTGTVLTYRYDASGNRVEKQLLQGGTTTTTRYVRDASGNVMATYQASTTAAGATAGEVLAEQPLYGSSRLGLYKGGRLGGQRRLAGSRCNRLESAIRKRVRCSKIVMNPVILPYT